MIDWPFSSRWEYLELDTRFRHTSLARSVGDRRRCNFFHRSCLINRFRRHVMQYKAYSPLFLSTTFTLSYGLSFVSITATLVHAFLYFRKQIYVQARRHLRQPGDLRIQQTQGSGSEDRQHLRLRSLLHQIICRTAGLAARAVWQ